MIALAQYFELEHKLQCDDATKIINAITEIYKEEPIWIGNMTSTVKAVLFVNPNTSDWTYLIVSESKACIMNTGSGFSLRPLVRSNKLSYSIDNNYNI